MYKTKSLVRVGLEGGTKRPAWCAWPAPPPGPSGHDGTGPPTTACGGISPTGAEEYYFVPLILVA